MTKSELLTRIQQQLDAGNSDPKRIYMPVADEAELCYEYIEELQGDNSETARRLDEDPTYYRKLFPTLDGREVIWDAKQFRLE